MLKAECPHCHKINSEILWNETTAEKRHMNLKRLTRLADEHDFHAEYYCPECEQVAEKKDIVVVSDLKKVIVSAYGLAHTLALPQLKALRESGVVDDTTDEITKALSSVDAVFALSAVPEETVEAEMGSSMRRYVSKISGTLYTLKCYTLREDNTPHIAILGHLCFSYDVRKDATEVYWRPLAGDMWHDAVAFIKEYRQTIRPRKRANLNYTPPKARVGEDGTLFVSYPVGGGKMKRIKLEQLIADPSQFNPELTFEEFLKILSKAEPGMTEAHADMAEEPLTTEAACEAASIAVSVTP